MKPQKLKYTGAMVLGMHDALVSLTGLIAGLAFALADRYSIIMSAIIASVAASLSMAASSFLAERAAGRPNASTSAAYTGGAYILTCVALILPFFIIASRGAALITTFAIAVLIIFLFNYCVCRRMRRSCVRPFLEMLGICAGVSVVAFVIGQMAKYIV